MADGNTLWQTKVAAWIHDPAEKALVLLRDPAGHENGTSRALARLLGYHELTPELLQAESESTLARTLFRKGIPLDIYKHVQRADWWAAAADRPNFPMDELPVKDKQGGERVLKVASWAQVAWSRKPVLIHPLTGEYFDLGKAGSLDATALDAIKQRSFDHFTSLALKVADSAIEAPDWRKLYLAFWRFGPELKVSGADTEDHDKLGVLWDVLPADTRIPDHSIWDHLDLASAFAGAFVADPEGEVALLTLSIGPVQPFIAAARSTSDLWAGSHLLSRLSWEAMRPVCERFGPDAILFPRLRRVPQVDVWLQRDVGLPAELFKGCEWREDSTDANPLFSASLPNRFVAVLPARQAVEIARTVERSVRGWLDSLGEQVVRRLLETAGYDPEDAQYKLPFEQMQRQLQGFPEIHWAVVPFSLIRCRDTKRQRDLDVTLLSSAMRQFLEVEDGREPGFLDSPAWKLLREGIELRSEDGRTYTFMAPNPGILYPAVFDLAERVLAAAKNVRPFEQTVQQGWRCTLTGENECLALSPEHLWWTREERKSKGTLWTAVQKARPAWVKEGEHLSALPAIKRVWPTLFAEEVRDALSPSRAGEPRQISRFVVSTHTMAMAQPLLQSLNSPVANTLKEKLKAWAGAAGQLSRRDYRVALPRKLVKAARRAGEDLDAIARIPGWLEWLKDNARESPETSHEYRSVLREIEDALGDRLETYYSLIMMDGDRMGAILVGDESTGTVISYLESFHPHVQAGFRQRAATQARLADYAIQKRAIAPSRHQAISGALNDFSQVVVRHVLEEEYMGRVIYSGGDDVLAMLPVSEMLAAMQRLRHAYSGTSPAEAAIDWGELRQRKGLVCKNGYAWLNGRLMRMMGRHATASCGAVVAHHQAPLSAVMRELRRAEQRAKQKGHRDAFSITVIKRSGGALYLTEKWGEPVTLLIGLRDFLAHDGVSRRAVYHTLEWLDETWLPASAFDTGLATYLLEYQLKRQTAAAELKPDAVRLARQLTQLARGWPVEERVARLRNFLSVAEFLGRGVRSGE